MNYQPLYETTKPPKQAWIGFDLDGTLAEYLNWSEYPGKPIENIVNLVHNYIDAGFTVKIFTARASVPSNVPLVEHWCEQNLGVMLEVTNIKDLNCLRIYDDRAIQVVFNKGLLVGNYLNE